MAGMAGYHSLVSDGLTQLPAYQVQAYAKMLEANRELSPNSMFINPAISDISPYPSPFILGNMTNNGLQACRYPSIVPNSGAAVSEGDGSASLCSYQISNTTTKTTNSLQYPITGAGDPTYPLNANKMNMFSSPHSFPTMQSQQAAFSIPSNLLLSSPQYQLPIIYHPVQGTMNIPTMPNMSNMPGISNLTNLSGMSMLQTSYLNIPANHPPNQTINTALNPAASIKVNRAEHVIFFPT